MNLLLYTDEFLRGSAYENLGPMVITADWRGVVGLLRARPDMTVLCELSSARAIDALRMVLGDVELKTTRIIGIAVDAETTETARRMGLSEIVEDGDIEAIREKLR